MAASVVRVGDRLLNVVIAVMLIAALLFGGYGMWDTWKIYHNASVSADLLQYKPSSVGYDTPNPILGELQKINPDVCGWLTVDGTHIDYPILQGENNWQYLNWDVNKDFSLSGSIFLDYTNESDLSDPFSLIHGHHMEGSVMFGEIPKFLKDDYFAEHTTGTIYTPEHTMSITWFACIATDAYDMMIYGPTKYRENKSTTELIAYLKENATQFRDIDVTDSDQLVALSTCADSATDGRTVLVGCVSRD